MNVKNALLIAVVSFLLHLAWEYAHLPLYTGYEGLGGPLPMPVFAALGDVLYTLLVLGVMSAIKRDMRWLASPARQDYAAMAVLGLCAAVFVEYKAMLLGRWSYTALMPTLYGYGLDPLLQMAILLPLPVCVARLIQTRRS